MKHNICKPVPGLLEDKFLSNYMFADVIFSPYCGRREMIGIFDEYARVFRVSGADWLDEIKETVFSDIVSCTCTKTDFNRVIRLSELFPGRISDLERYVLTQKSAAVITKAELLEQYGRTTFESTLQILRSKAYGGQVDCISLVGFLEYNGFLTEPDRASAEKRIRAAASWNDLFATLMGAVYLDDKPFYHGKLLAVLGSSASPDLPDYLKNELGIGADALPDPVASSLERAICRGIYEPSKLNRDVVKIMRSAVLSDKGKCDLIKSARENTCFPSEIPLGVTRSSDIRPVYEVFADPPCQRKDEYSAITANLSMVDMRATSSYKPLLFVCSDELVLSFYRNAILSSLQGAPAVRIGFHEGGDCDLSHSSENVFISALEKTGDRNTVIIFDNCELLDEAHSAGFANYLRSSGRRYYKSAGLPSVDIDLSGILPILFASKLPDNCITEKCDVILAADLSHDEFRTVLAGTLAKKQIEFGLDSLSMEPPVSEFLYDYSTDSVMNLIDKAILDQRTNSRDVNLSVNALNRIIEQHYKVNNRPGFWRSAT